MHQYELQAIAYFAVLSNIVYNIYRVHGEYPVACGLH